MYTYEIVTSPKSISVAGQSKQLNRINMSTPEEIIVGWTDYIIDSGWSKFTEFFVIEEHRTEENILSFIRAGYKLVPEPKQTFWWSATESMRKYFEAIVSEMPHMTFAAGGAIQKLVPASIVN